MIRSEIQRQEQNKLYLNEQEQREAGWVSQQGDQLDLRGKDGDMFSLSAGSSLEGGKECPGYRRQMC